MTKKLIFMMLLASQVALAQLTPNQNQIAKYFPAAAVPSGGAANLQTLIGGYIKPIGEDFGSLSNNGWYSTASTHQKLGFDFSVTMNSVFANSDAKFYTPGTLTGVTFQGSPTSSNPNKAPTAYGGETDIPTFQFNGVGSGGGPNQLIPFSGPSGGNISKDVPIGTLLVPTIQAGIGLFANTDLKIRYTPAVTISGTELKNMGFGIQHDIKQHIPGIKMAPFSLSLLLAYSQLTATTDLKGYYSGTGQQGVGETTGYTAQVLISKSIPVVTFYGGLGYNSSATTYKIKGTYTVDKTDAGIPLIAPVNLTDPFTQKYTSNGFRGTIGIRLKFGPVALNSDYTLVSSKTLLTLGFGFTFR